MRECLNKTTVSFKLAIQSPSGVFEGFSNATCCPKQLMLKTTPRSKTCFPTQRRFQKTATSLRYFYGEEPVTQGKKYEEALAMAADWLLSVATIAKEKQDELQSLLSPKTEKL